MCYILTDSSYLLGKAVYMVLHLPMQPPLHLQSSNFIFQGEISRRSSELKSGANAKRSKNLTHWLNLLYQSSLLLLSAWDPCLPEYI